MHRKKLFIKLVHCIPCDICQRDCVNYRQCIGPHVYCSAECFEILYLDFCKKRFNDWDEAA